MGSLRWLVCMYHTTQWKALMHTWVIIFTLPFLVSKVPSTISCGLKVPGTHTIRVCIFGCFFFTVNNIHGFYGVSTNR